MEERVNSYGHIMAVGDAHVFPGFSHTSTNTTFFPKPPTTFLTCFNRDERRKYAVKKIHLNQVPNSQLRGHEFDTLTTEPPERGRVPSVCYCYSWLIFTDLNDKFLF